MTRHTERSALDELRDLAEMARCIHAEIGMWLNDPALQVEPRGFIERWHRMLSDTMPKEKN